MKKYEAFVYLENARLPVGHAMEFPEGDETHLVLTLQTFPVHLSRWNGNIHLRPKPESP